MDPTTRLRIATRIHFGLKRQFGEDVEVSTLLRSETEAREVLWVCEASGDAELMSLARQFARANRHEAAANRASVARDPVQSSGRTPQDTGWSQDTSGFGLSRPPELEHPAEAPHSWFSTPSWLRRSGPRNSR